MEFEAPKSRPKAEKTDAESEFKKRALLGKLAEDAVVELHGKTAPSAGAEGEMFSQDRIDESGIRHETQVFMDKRQAEVIAEREKLQAKKPNSVRVAEAAADAVLLEQTRVELAATPLDVPTENGLQTAKVRTEKLIDKAMGIAPEPEGNPNQPSFEGAISPVTNQEVKREDLPSLEQRPATIQGQITHNENDIRARAARQFEQVTEPKEAIEALQNTTSAYAELVPLYKQQLAMQELTTIGNRITFEGMTLTQLYETRQFDEAALRRIVAEFLTGGNVEAAIRSEKQAYEGHYERDPRMRAKVATTALATGINPSQTIDLIAPLAQNLRQIPPDATGINKKSTLPLPELSSLKLGQLKHAQLQQVLIVLAVGLFMIALIFLALALTH